MPIDSSIYGNIRQFSIPDPLEQAGKAMQVQAGALQLQDAQRKFSLEDDISKALSDSGGDLTKAADLLAKAGRGQASLSLRDKAQAQQKANAEAMQHDQTRFTSLLPVLRDDLAKVNDDAGLAAHRDYIASLAGSFATPQFQQQMTRLSSSLPAKFDPAWKQSQLLTADEVLKRMTPKVEMVDQGGTKQPWNMNPQAEGGIGPIQGAPTAKVTAKPAEPTELARLMTERDALPENDPRRARYDEVIKGYKAGKGGVEINSPLVGPMTPTKTTANKIDEGLLDTTRGLMQLDQIAGQFRPEYQQILTKASNLGASWKEKLGGSLTVKERKDLEDFSAFKRNSIDALNAYIKSVTGAAMTNAEADRILKGLPNPGSGLMDGDSPTEFKAKLDDAISKAKFATARLTYIKRHGMSLEDGAGNAVVSLERMPTLINERGREIETELKKSQPNADPNALRRAVRRQLGAEFGLSSD